VTAVALAADTPAPSHASVVAALRGGEAAAPLQAIDLPHAPVPVPQLAQRLGGSVVDALRTADTGQVVGPLAGGGRSVLYLMVHERLADAPRYEEVADSVRTEWARRQAEAALSQLLVSLRQSTAVRLADAPDLD